MIRATSLAAMVITMSALGGAPALAQASGSYRATCTDVDQRGPYLRALCRDVRGRLVQTQLDLRGCGGSVSNINGRLACDGGGRGYGRGGRDRDEYGGRDRRRDRDDDDDYGSRRGYRY